MLTNSNLRKYIKKLIIESIEDEEYNKKNLEDLQAKYNNDINEKNAFARINARNEKFSTKGWNLLNTIIDSLKSLDNRQRYTSRYGTKKKHQSIIELLEDDLNFDRIGKGAFRDVYTRSDVDFVVKVEIFEWDDNSDKMISTGANKAEYDTYFDFTDYQSNNKIFPKVYSYDEEDGMWIIAEKVNNFHKRSDPNVYKIFQPLITTLSEVIDFIKSERSFKNFPDSPFYDTRYYDGSDVVFYENESKEALISNPSYADSFYLFQICYSFIQSLIYQNNKSQNLTVDFKNEIINWVITNFTWMNSYQNAMINYPDTMRVINDKFSEYFHDLKPTPDVLYLVNAIKHEEILDVRLDNVGYRNMKNNPSEPWKNLVILDYGQYGGDLQNTTDFVKN